MKINLNKINKNVKTNLFGEVLYGIPYEQTTPEWNIEHYSMLLKYTKKSVLRRKHQEDLKWWVESKEKREKGREM